MISQNETQDLKHQDKSCAGVSLPSTTQCMNVGFCNFLDPAIWVNDTHCIEDILIILQIWATHLTLEKM